MSLATRCAACGTVFRVVQDQLKVSEGWVRCGRCNEVFNALEGLFDLTREMPADSYGQRSATVQRPSPTAGETAAGVDGSAVRVVDRAEPPFAPNGEPAAVAPIDDALDSREFSDARFPSDMAGPAGAEAPATAATTPLGARSPLDANANAAEPAATAAFVRHAGRRARWRSPRAIGVQVGAAAVLAAALCAQVAHHQRDVLAAGSALGAAGMKWWCQGLGCVVGPLQRIEDVVIDSSALTPLAGSDALQATIVLRNRGSVDVAQPWIELSLTDANGRLIARRALSPREFGVPTSDASLRAGVDSTFELALSTGDVRVSGYAVEAFYP